MVVSKHERDCHLRANERDMMGQNGTRTQISGMIFFENLIKTLLWIEQDEIDP